MAILKSCFGRTIRKDLRWMPHNYKKELDKFEPVVYYVSGN